ASSGRVSFSGAATQNVRGSQAGTGAHVSPLPGARASGERVHAAACARTILGATSSSGSSELDSFACTRRDIGNGIAARIVRGNAIAGSFRLTTVRGTSGRIRNDGGIPWSDSEERTCFAKRHLGERIGRRRDRIQDEKSLFPSCARGHFRCSSRRGEG